MSITVITINDYKNRFPDTALNNIRDARIHSAINLAFSFLDVKCGCAITSRWEIVAPTAGYLTEEQKNYVKEAFYVETQYILSNNLDFSQGSDQTSFGSLSTSSSRPFRKEVCESALMYLQKAGLYDYINFSTPTYAGSGNVSETETDVSLDPLNQYITYVVGDNRYVAKHQETANKWLKTNENGDVILSDMTIDPTLYYTKTEINAILDPISDKMRQLNLGYLAKITRNTLNKTITITNDVGDIITFPYGGAEGCITDVKVNGVSVVTNAVANINLTEYAKLVDLASKVSLLGNEAVSGQPYHFPYHLVMNPTASNIGLTAYTITLDNEKTLTQYPFTIPAATSSTAGLLTAADKIKVDDLQVVTANPTIVGTEPDLTTLQIGSAKYKVAGGGSSISSITITGDSGTLTEAQYQTLLLSPDNYINWSNASYSCVLKRAFANTYTGIDTENNSFKLYITDTTARTWTITRVGHIAFNDNLQTFTERQTIQGNTDMFKTVLETDGIVKINTVNETADSKSSLWFIDSISFKHPNWNSSVLGPDRLTIQDFTTTDVTNQTTYKYDTIVRSSTTGGTTTTNTITLPNATGTLALVSDIPTGFVTTDTAQTISGGKTFTSSIIANGGINAGIQSITCATANINTQTITPDVRRGSASASLSLHGGTYDANGATISLVGGEASGSNKGNFTISATRNASGSITAASSNLVGTPDGDLKWNGNNVIIANNASDYVNPNALITIGNTKQAEQILAKPNSNEQRIAILGGSQWSEGPIFALSGTGATFNAGCFDIRANNGTNSKTLLGKPDGTLTWDGDKVLTQPDNIVLTAGSGITINNYFCRKIGNMVFMSVFLSTGSSAISGWADIITGNPKAAVGSYNCICKNGGTTKRIYITNNNTAIQASEGLEANSQYFINCAYIAA